MELCGAKGSYQIVPDDITAIDLDAVGGAIEAAGYEVGVRSRLCWTFTGRCEMTLYPSGKLMVRTEDNDRCRRRSSARLPQWVKA